MPLKKNESTEQAANETKGAASNKAELVGDNKDLDPASPEGLKWISDQEALALAAKQREEDARKEELRQEELRVEEKRKEQERKELEQKQEEARKQREAEAQKEQELAEELAKKQEAQKLPAAGRYSSAKSRLRDPVSGKSFLVGQGTLVKKADISKWFITQLNGGLLVPFVEDAEEE